MKAAYTKGDRWLDSCVGYIDQNLDLVGEFLCARLPLVCYRKPEGTYLAWLDFNPMGVARILTTTCCTRLA